MIQVKVQSNLSVMKSIVVDHDKNNVDPPNYLIYLLTAD